MLWGFLLWLFGYILGFVLFFVVPTAYLGWVIMPLGIFFTLWVLSHKIPHTTLDHYIIIALIWTIIAIVCDYYLLVKVLHPADGYYKLDVYLYYLITFMLPIIYSTSHYVQKKSAQKSQ